MIGYVNLEEAKEFLKNRYDISQISDDELKRALYLALDKIENLNIRDSGKSSKQELIFPRINENEIPFNIKKAQMLESYSIINATDEDNDIQKGILSKSIGDMSIGYDTTNKRAMLQFINLESARIMSLYERKTYGYSS
ncbi:MAG: DnaT-like ssDNA-binding protein [Fusobacterium gastrosuis]|uniref:DnaT-like ssDNA-binding protein n=1 Tax=Fusobacterium gastrosuis TaxID=1755100 RepID=UPI002A87FD67|nr:DnaT-like ssDNA-binding protein [Fusobacterium gastrosuis]